MSNWVYRFTAALLCLAGAHTSAAEAAWLRAESPNFIVYGEMPEAKLRAQVVELEDYDDLLRSLTGTTAKPVNKLNIYLVRGGAELRKVRRVGSGVAGFYWHSKDGILAVSDMSAQTGLEADDVLLHEYAHHFMLQYYPAAYPTWFVEGFAEYLMTAEFKPGFVEYGRPNENRIEWMTYKWIPLDKVLHSDPGKLKGDEIIPFYAQSWLTVHYVLRDKERRAALSRYLAAVGKGEDSRTAFTQSFKMGVLEFQSAVRAYTHRGSTYSRRKRGSAGQAPNISVTPLPKSADDLLLYQAGLRTGVTDKTCSHYLRPVRSASGRHDDALARRVLAHAETLCGDRAKANALLDQLIAAAPQDAELLYLRGMSDFLAGKADEARRKALCQSARAWFTRTHKADETYFPALYRYAESLAGDPEFLSENTLNVMLLARQTAPQVEEIAIDSARLLMLNQRFADAEVLLAPIAARAHGGKVAKLAQSLLTDARGKVTNGANITPFVHPADD